MEPWEALDLDDSDLPSLLPPLQAPPPPLRPPQSHPLTATPLSSPTSPTQFPYPLVTQFSTHFHYPLSNPNVTTPLQAAAAVYHFRLLARTIQGPAGAVQSAMLRKAQANRNPASSDDSLVLPTQEYIRRAVEEGKGEDDDDFQRNPWLCALEFLGQQGMVENGLPITPLSSIKKYRSIERVDQDPTGSIDASIHRKVLAEVEFGKHISVGSVLILQKVVVFAPSRSAQYLNITLSNVVKVHVALHGTFELVPQHPNTF